MNKSPVCTTDEIENAILSDGYIANSKLQRRWLMSQMLRHHKVNGIPNFDKYFILSKPYYYEWKTTIDEINTLSQISVKEMTERSRFFNANVISDMLNSYKKNILEYAENLKNFKLTTRNKQVCIQLSSHPNMTINELKCYIGKYTKRIELCMKMQSSRKRIYGCLHKALVDFAKNCPMPKDLEKSKAWINAFKGAGAYYTMTELVKFHGFRLSVNNTPCDLYESLSMIEKKTNECDGIYSDLYDFMEMFIETNPQSL